GQFQPLPDLAGVGLGAQGMDGDFLQRSGSADQLEEGTRRLGVFSDIGGKPSGQFLDGRGQPGRDGGVPQAYGNQVQGSAGFHAGAPCVMGSIPKERNMRQRAISGSPMMAVGSSLCMACINAMPRPSALALPAVSNGFSWCR